MGDLREENGVVLENGLSNLDCGVWEVWDRAEAEAWELIRQVQPTVVSEERRRDVVDYVQRLLKGYLGCEVFPFGSVPLKTYLPDGDIDLTAFCGFNVEEAFANDVYSVLVSEDLNPTAKFVVKDVQYIRAEVKLVKCLVQNIVVDISFNQIGGLCTLGFLEEIDRLIGKDHLFKRSIILIKAWCYYESRILGAHHGLISTYALETLVLYIFHLFHTSLDGPLAVLHKFLDYFSKFDWENLCVSLNGPVRLASLPEIVVEKPETSGRELLSDDFMRECVRNFSVPSRGAESNYKTFALRHLNIVDPLKENNNLGRSISKGNFFRIRSAFLYGAKKLGQILLPSQENIEEEVRKFFGNTLDRHGNGHRPDVPDHLQLSNGNRFTSEIPLSFDEPYQDPPINAPEDGFVYCNNQSSVNRVTFEDANIKEENEHATSLLEDKMENGYLDEETHKESSLTNGQMENGHLDEELHSEQCSEYRSSNMVNGLPDLSGDVDCHLENLLHGRWLYEQGLAMSIHPVQLVPPFFHPNVPWDPMHPPVNGVIPRPPFVPANPPARGIGTYFPMDPLHSYRDRPSPKGRYHGQLKSPRINGKGPFFQDRSLPPVQGPLHLGTGRPRYPDYHETPPRGKFHKETNGFLHAHDNAVEYDPDPPRNSSPEAETSTPSDLDPSPESQNIEPDSVVDDDSRPSPSVDSYRLKDEEDFPPL